MGEIKNTKRGCAVWKNSYDASEEEEHAPMNDK